MVFSSIYFVLYFLPVFLLVYYLAPQKWKNLTLLLGSSYFYAWGEPTFFFIILFSLILDFYLIRMMYYAEGKLKKILFTTVLVLNISNLLIHKYLMFFVYNLNFVLSSLEIPEISLLIFLPIGISFITFQKLSYAIDVHRGTTEVQHNFVDYSLYILLFPQLIAGPIIRYHEIKAQIADRSKAENLDNKLLGLFRFIVGLSKKVLIADPIGIFVDEVFAIAPVEISTPMLWLGLIAYSLQLYYDFSGYSDMALGLARMMGFDFPENFNFPYISQSVSEYWRRWHITLGHWMRDYLYIPLGGNRVSKRRMYFNLWLVFLFSGLWHGASWNFVVFGAYHGIFLVLEKGFLKNLYQKAGPIPRVLFTYTIILISYVIFRHEEIGLSFSYIGRMFSFQFHPDLVAADAHVLFLMLIGFLFAFAGINRRIEEGVETLYKIPKGVRGYALLTALSLLLGLACITELFAADFNPFIYFRF